MPAKKRVAPRKRGELKPVTFVPVEQVFKPAIKVRFTRDISGWASRDQRKKWGASEGQVAYLSEDAAREYEVKGYVEILDGTVKPVSEDEAAEILSSVTTIGL